MKIIIINGAPESGKDTFVSICANENLPYTLNISTVDFVKKVATFCGWDGSKTPINRKFLSDLKQLLVGWNDVPLRDIEQNISNFIEKLSSNNLDTDRALIFIHCREPEEIKKLVEKFDAQTLLIRRIAAERKIASNTSDLNILNYDYDYILYNDSTIDELRKVAKKFLKEELNIL